jgi:diacylglycerol kinase (ATP)
VTPRLIITNAAAGGTDEDAVEAALDVLRAGGPVEVAATEDAAGLDRALDTAARLDGEEDPVVVVVGGDGSLHALLNALHRRDELARTRVGLVPLGTGNDFARELGLSLDPAEAARQHLDGVERGVDALVDDRDRLTINAVHLGVGAEAGREASAWKRRLGTLGYAVGAVKAGVTAPGLHLRITVDGRRLEHSHGVMQVAISNGSFVGGGAELAPDADPHDGRADVVVSYANAPLARLGYALHLRRGEHALRDDVLTVRARRVEVEGDAFSINSDGEVSGTYRRLSWQVRPAAVRMVLPA